MLDGLQSAALSPLPSSYYEIFFVALVLWGGYLLVTWLWWDREERTRPFLRYRKGSTVVDNLVQSCSTLREDYTPTYLWGRNGHVQTVLFAVMGRFSIQEVRGERCSVVVEDGSTVLYDLFEPEEGKAEHTILVCPGIGSTSETDYMRSFAAFGTNNGFRVAILNHMGALLHTPITGKRIFTYGGTGDFAAMFEDMQSRFPETRFIGVGFSMGACILVRFLGEREERQKQFLCVASICQGYDAAQGMNCIHDWSNLRRIYNAGITRKMLKVLRRHRDSLFTADAPEASAGGSMADKDRDHNGFSLDPAKILPPEEEKLWSASSFGHLDEYYTRRVMGFETTAELYRWTSCVEMMYNIGSLPFLIVNARDDPLVPEHLHTIPMKYTEHNPNAIFVRTEYGGHLGFFEGGLLRANPVTWVDRLLLEYIHACMQLSGRTEPNGLVCPTTPPGETRLLN